MSVRTILAPNPGPMTLSGTNTYVLTVPGTPAVVIDPGPDIDSHLTAIIEACPDGISEIWLTHHHLDHSEAAPKLAARSDAPVRAARESRCRSAAPLLDGEQVILGPGDPGSWCALTTVAIPGHTSDSIGFLVETGATDTVLLTGDMVLGAGTTVITSPDGDLGDFFTSLEVMQEVVDRHRVATMLPGHGPAIDDPIGVLHHYRRHRRERLEQVRAAVDNGARSAAEVVDQVYLGLAPELRRAAEQSAQAQIDYLNK